LQDNFFQFALCIFAAISVCNCRYIYNIWNCSLLFWIETKEENRACHWIRRVLCCWIDFTENDLFEKWSLVTVADNYLPCCMFSVRYNWRPLGLLPRWKGSFLSFWPSPRNCFRTYARGIYQKITNWEGELFHLYRRIFRNNHGNSRLNLKTLANNYFNWIRGWSFCNIWNCFSYQPNDYEDKSQINCIWCKWSIIRKHEMEHNPCIGHTRNWNYWNLLLAKIQNTAGNSRGWTLWC